MSTSRREDTIRNYFDEESCTDDSTGFLSPDTQNETNGNALNASISNHPLASSSRRSLGRTPTKSSQKPRPKSKQKQTRSSSMQRTTWSNKSQKENEMPSRRSQRIQEISNISPKQTTQHSRRKLQKPKKHVLYEIRKYQATTSNLIPKLPFSKLIKQIIGEYSDTNMRVTPAALEAIQESAEIYLTVFFEDAYRCALHRGRVTLIIKDMELVRILRGVNDPGYRTPNN
ncbi:uncharacterized protein LOC129605594 [Condylostylus longicornis]|uniref:uncharacterized protein LOC129605594 n=1 Tax=Condylostylus longicornis TaxID=2530218 RepID=UPI00244E5317|nr:uncharacterized protein LOC129605594 [Condylostylus longicornis]